MLNLVVFETEEELCELTGLTEPELWDKGFNLRSSYIKHQQQKILSMDIVKMN